MKLSSMVMALVIVFVLQGGPALAQETFVHPGGAFQLTTPAGWHRLAGIDADGCPFYVFSPDSAEDAGQFSTGLWAIAVPIPTDDDLAKDDVSVLAEQILQAEEPGLTMQKVDNANAKLGNLPAALLELRGKRNGAASRGQMLVAVQQDSFLVVRYGCDPGQWEQMLPTFQGMVGGFVAPVKRAAFAQPLPAQAQEARDVSDKLALSVPLIHIMIYENQDASQARPDPLGNLNPAAARQKKEIGWGSGFVIRSDGYVITNRHVVSEETDGKFSRTAYDPVELTWDQAAHLPRVRADVVAVSRRYDMALLKIADTSRKWQAVPLSDLSQVRNGDRVLVMGWPDPQELGDTDVNHNEGTLAAIEHDSHGRIIRLRHSARTTQGNSGGPLYDLDTGSVIGIHFQGIFSHAHDMTEILYHGTVPIDQVLWEFPQVTIDSQKAGAAKMSLSDRQALIAGYFQEERFGAAILEGEAALAQYPRDGLINAYLYRLYAMESAPDQAQACLKIALGQPRSRARALLFAGRTALECDDVKMAQNAASQAIRLAPTNPEGYIILGEAEIGMGNYDGAESDLTHAGQMMKGLSPEAEGYLGWLPIQQWLVQNQVNKMPWSITLPADIAARANQHLEASYKLWPSRNWGSLGDLGLVAGFSGDLDHAADLVQAAIDSCGDDPDATLMGAYYQCLLSNGDDAVQFAQSAMDARETPRAHFILAWGLLLQADAANKAGKSDDAQKDLKLAVIHEEIAAKDAPDAFWAPIALRIVDQVTPALQQ